MISFNLSNSSVHVFLVFKLTLKTLLTKSIAIGLFSSANDLLGSVALIILPNCCKYNILELSSSGLNQISPSILLTCTPSFNLFITSINLILSDVCVSNFSKFLLLIDLLYFPSIELNSNIENNSSSDT